MDDGSAPYPLAPSKTYDPRDRYADARDSSFSTDSNSARYPLSRQYGQDQPPPLSEISQSSSQSHRQEEAEREALENEPLPPLKIIGPPVLPYPPKSTDHRAETPQGYPLAQFPPGHFPPPPPIPMMGIYQRSGDGGLKQQPARHTDVFSDRPPQVHDRQTDTRDRTPDSSDVLNTPDSGRHGQQPRHSRSHSRCIDKRGRTPSPPMKSSISADILLSDAVMPGSLSTGDLRLKPKPSRSQHSLGYLGGGRDPREQLYATPGKLGGSQATNKSWRQSEYSVDRVEEIDTVQSRVPPPPKREPSVRKKTTDEKPTKKRRFKHLRDRHYPICIAVSFATMLCINPPIGFVAVVFSYLSWKAYDRGDERTGFILARSALYTSLAGIIFTMTVVITTLYQTTIGF